MCGLIAGAALLLCGVLAPAVAVVGGGDCWEWPWFAGCGMQLQQPVSLCGSGDVWSLCFPLPLEEVSHACSARMQYLKNILYYIILYYIILYYIILY